MRTVALAGTDIVSSVLGFGCNALLGDKSRAEGLKLLESAHDAGINYFDVARLYGYGEAERLVGELCRGRRTQFVIATKFGIAPLLPPSGTSYIRPIVRALMRRSPRLRRILGRSAGAAVKTHRFAVDDARISLEASLRALQTDFIDVLLLHDCGVEDVSDDLLEFLQAAQRSGKVRYFGVATSVDAVRAILSRWPAFARILQFQNSVLSENDELIDKAPGAVITHGALGGSFPALRRYLSLNAELARTWSERVQADCGDPPTLAALMLNYAVQVNTRGPVLFHSRHVESIYADVRTVERSRIMPEQLHTFARLCRESGVRPD